MECVCQVKGLLRHYFRYISHFCKQSLQEAMAHKCPSSEFIAFSSIRLCKSHVWQICIAKNDIALSRLISAHLVAVDDDPRIALEVTTPLRELTLKFSAVSIKLRVHSRTCRARLEVAVFGELAWLAIELKEPVIVSAGSVGARVWQVDLSLSVFAQLLVVMCHIHEQTAERCSIDPDLGPRSSWYRVAVKYTQPEF